jgi:hypothetical protein
VAAPPQLETDWHTGTNPDVLLAHIHAPYVPPTSPPEPPNVIRRLQLFECACARMVWELLPTDARSAVLVRERFANGQATEADLRASAIRQTRWLTVTYQDHALQAAAGSPRSAASALACRAAGPAPSNYHKMEKWHSIWNTTFAAARAHQAELVRDIFPPPDHAVRALRLDRDWLTSTVLALARQMDADGEYSAVPILADALQDAGCGNELVLDRCRAPSGIHCRGNWVVDLLLGRE